MIEISSCTLAAWTDFLTETKFLQNAVWQWLALLGVLLVSFVAGKIASLVLLQRARKIQQAGRMQMAGMLLESLARPTSLLVIAGGLYVAQTFMTLEENMSTFWVQVCRTTAVMAAGWFIYRLVDVIEHFLHRWTSKTETLLDDQLVPLIRKSLRVFVVIIAALFIAQNIFKWNIGTLVAGLGLGGLAFALAAKDMLANLFGSATIFADRPFQMGDLVRIQGYYGTIAEVGFRSTRINTLDGHLVTLPNAVVANEAVENVGRRPFIKRTLNVTVTYDTAPEKLQRGVEIIREMLDASRDHFHGDFPSRVYFSDFNADSLNIIVYYWFTPPDWWQYNAFNHEFNTELLRRFNEEGLEFAFPTQTLYVKQDSPIEADIRLRQKSGESGKLD